MDVDKDEGNGGLSQMPSMISITSSVRDSPSKLSMNSRSDLLKESASDNNLTDHPIDNTDQRPGIRQRIKRRIKATSSRLWAFTKSKRCQQEILRTSMAVVIFACITSLMMMAQMISDEWFDKYTKSLVIEQTEMKSMSGFRDVFATDPLYDRLFTILPDWQNMRGFLPDALLTSYIAAFVIFNVLWVHRKRIQYQGLVVLRRFLWIMSCLYLFRTMTFLVTTVPNPVHNCVPKYVQTEDFEDYVRLIKDMASGKVSACTDNIYSGHTTMTAVIFFSFWMYSGKLVLQIYALLHAAAIIAAILITHLHYTVDVLIAMFMSAFVFLTFHFLLTVMLDDKLLDMAEPDATTGVKHILANERRTLHRVYKDSINKAVWWMDGFDLRIASAERQELSEDPAIEGIEEEQEDLEDGPTEMVEKPASPTVNTV